MANSDDQWPTLIKKVMNFVSYDKIEKKIPIFWDFTWWKCLYMYARFRKACCLQEENYTAYEYAKDEGSKLPQSLVRTSQLTRRYKPEHWNSYQQSCECFKSRKTLNAALHKLVSS